MKKKKEKFVFGVFSGTFSVYMCLRTTTRIEVHVFNVVGVFCAMGAAVQRSVKASAARESRIELGAVHHEQIRNRIRKEAVRLILHLQYLLTFDHPQRTVSNITITAFCCGSES